MSKAPAFQLYAADFYMDTVGWSCEEVGLYFRLLMAEWVNGPLPNDSSRLAKVCQTSVKKFDHNFKNVSPKFVQNSEGYLVNPRLEATREKQAKYSESRKEVANKRWEKKDAHALHTDMHTGCPSSSSSSSTTNTKEDVTKKPRKQSLTDQQYFDLLKNNTAYKGIDIDREIGKCQAWCVTNHKLFSRRRFLNWLNRVEKPMTVDRPIGYNGRPVIRQPSELERLKKEESERGEPTEEDIRMAKKMVNDLIKGVSNDVPG